MRSSPAGVGRRAAEDGLQGLRRTSTARGTAVLEGDDIAPTPRRARRELGALTARRTARPRRRTVAHHPWPRPTVSRPPLITPSVRAAGEHRRVPGPTSTLFHPDACAGAARARQIGRGSLNSGGSTPSGDADRVAVSSGASSRSSAQRSRSRARPRRPRCAGSGAGEGPTVGTQSDLTETPILVGAGWLGRSRPDGAQISSSSDWGAPRSAGWPSRGEGRRSRRGSSDRRGRGDRCGPTA
jgi:hypothetical protein